MFTLQCVVVILLFCEAITYAQELNTNSQVQKPNLLAEKIGNFSIELLYLTTQQKEKSLNMIMSPVTTWSLLAMVAEGAAGRTLDEICITLRITRSKSAETREAFKRIFQWLQVKTDTVDLERFNAIFVDTSTLLLRDFVDVATDYNARMVAANFSESQRTATIINNAVSTVTHGRIPTIITGDDIANSHMIITSAVYFKGQWTVPFSASRTTVQPFYSSTGWVLGDVNMMYNRHTYPNAYIKSLQARILEIPYGKEHRLSMLIMLPDPVVSLKDMFYNFNDVSLDSVFTELKKSAKKTVQNEVDCFIPRFRIQNKLDLTEILKTLGIKDLFDEKRVRLPLIATTLLFASKVIHNAEIEVTEEGTKPSVAATPEVSDHDGVARFEANRPFCYLIVDKVTNIIAFGGLYDVPSLY